MPETSLVVVDPGHFHATLVQQQMYPELSPVVRVYAPLGPDLIDYLSRIARYNRRPQAATDWRLDVHAGPDFLDRIRDEPPGGVAIFSGRNRGKIDRIIAALEAGLHVLADKPAIIEPADLPRLEAALTTANEQQLVLADMMTGRHNTLVRLLQALRCDPEVFGDPIAGTGDEPGVLLSGMHYLRKVVAGLPNPRPAWYFDVTEQGEGLADTGVHLVDRGHEMLFPEQPLDWRRDIEILAASRLAHRGEPAAISRANRRGQMARRPRTVDPRRCAGVIVQWTGRLSGARHSRPAGGALGLAGRAGRRYASRALPRYPLPARGVAGPRRTLSAGAIRPA